MPEQSGKADSAAAAADDSDSLTVNQGDGQSDAEGEEEEEMGEEEEEEGLDSEEEDVEAVEEEDGLDGEYEEFEEGEEEEDEIGDAEDEESEGMEEDGRDFDQEGVEEAEEEEEMEGGDGEEQEFKEVEEEDGGNSGEEELEEEEEEIEEKEEGDGKGEEEAGTGSVEAATTMQEDAEAVITVQEPAEAAITVQESAEVAATAQEGAKDFCEMVKSGRHDQYQNSLSSTAGDCNAGKHHEHDISKMFSTYSKVFSSTSMGNESSAMAVKPVLSKENGFPNTSLGGTFNGIQLGKQISNEAPKSVKNNYLETHGSNPSLATGNASSLLLQKHDLAVEGSVRSESETAKNGVSVTGESHLHGITDSQKLDDSNLTCVHTPQRRPRSSSPGLESDIMNKKPAVPCVFYASGWCIKGKACKFLHQKDGATTTEQQNKENKAEHSWISDSRGITEEIVEGSKVSSAVLEESNAEGPSERNSLLQRALVRTYGTGSHETSQLHGQYSIPAKGEFQQPDHFQSAGALVQEDYGRTFGKIAHADSVERQLSDGAFSSRRLHTEAKLVNEFPREDSPYETTFSRNTHLVDAFAPEYKYFGNSKLSSLHQNSSSAYGRTEDIAIRSAHSHFPNQESYNSHSLSGSRYSGLSSSFQLSQSDNRFSRAEISPKRSSNPSIEYLDDHTNRGYLSSRSVSFARDSSPYRSRPDLQYMTHPGDLTSRQKTKFQCNDWEPSQPFRPSLSIATSSITSPGSQYDPILDSIEPANASTRDYCFQTSQRTSFQNTSGWPTNIDTILNGTVTTVSPTWEGTLAKKVSLNDSSAHANVDVLFGSSKLERGDSSIPRNEKAWNPDHLVERSNIKDAEFGGDLRNRVDKSRNNKESKALKIFHAALVDFMKELVKPWWREGQLSKDAHKAVIKKSVEKVLSALQPHQVPSTQDAINQYLATSKPKLLKLVEGYVQKYANA